MEEIRLLKEKLETQASKISALEKKILSYEKKTTCVKNDASNADKKAIDSRIDEKIKQKFPMFEWCAGLETGIGVTTVAQGVYNANGNNEPLKRNIIDGSYSLDLTFSKQFDNYGKAFILLEQGNGSNVEDELQVFSNVNFDADNDNNVRATEVWYEHYFKDMNVPLAVTFGKIDPTLFIDDNSYANDETTQFLGRTFRNSPVIEFPDNALGVRMGYDFGEKVSADFLAVDGDSDWENIFDGMFYAGEINIKPSFLSREGNYRFSAWVNTQNHTEWLDSKRNKEYGYGFGTSCDQEITDSLGVFARYGWQNPKVYINSATDFSLEHAYSAGMRVKGLWWNREKDDAAIAFGQIFASKYYKKAGLEIGLDRKANPENHLECHYNCAINEHFTLTPDLQIIWNPYGGDALNGSKEILVGGIRAQINF
ncbi:carbohydrate-selective porin OprB [Candidatus Omnitrophus magneticus]|nr:carbohydrate-selective porin OprB [Candidatus Omnitrophus magneticus]